MNSSGKQTQALGSRFGLSLGSMIVLLALTGCSGTAFSPSAALTASSGSNSAQASPSTGGTRATLHSLQPTLAVRGGSCIMCHANIQSTVISDFGFGSPWALDQDKTLTDFSAGYYNPFGWQALKNLTGQVIVPTESLTGSYLSTYNLPNQTASLLSFLSTSQVTNVAEAWFSYFSDLGAPTATLSLTNAVTAPAGSPALIPQSTIYIGAPTAAQIAALGNGTPGTAVALNAPTGPAPVAGLSAVTGLNGATYITNSGTVNCQGLDVVVNGTLLLNNLNVNANSGGCRFYVTGSVFIEGEITYAGTSDGTENLQITSAEAVFMGVGLSGISYRSGNVAGDESEEETGLNPLHIRLIDDARNPEFRAVPNATAYATWSAQVYAEGANIGPSLLVDASSITGAASVETSAAGQSRRAINYAHLLLNAPMVHSRYLGTFNGVVIAELAEFSLGQFVFNFDPAFDSDAVPVLPLLQQDILCATSSPANCNPINP